MKWRDKRYTVNDLVSSYDKKLMITNSEYQRGEAWTAQQKGGFIDSILRGYPVPALILHFTELEAMGQKSRHYEIVDGQQRLIALHAFCVRKELRLPSLSSAKFGIPRAVREKKVTWSDLDFDQLSQADRSRLLETELLAIEISEIEGGEELRDLFIRLQAGTPLTRQQVRDAWPGSIGPFIDSLAGRKTRQPSSKLFSLVDKRGSGTDDEDLRDKFVSDRQTCAQLLRLFEARSSGLKATYVNVNAIDLDNLYHEQTDFDRHGEMARRFQVLLLDCERVFEIAENKTSKKKVRRVELFAVFLLFVDIRKNELNRVDKALYNAIARAHRSAEWPAGGRATSAGSIKGALDALIDTGILDRLIEKDPNRYFSASQKAELWKRDNGVCQLCQREVLEGSEEYDHIVRHELGGRTSLDNGRVVCKPCHQRGRLPED